MQIFHFWLLFDSRIFLILLGLTNDFVLVVFRPTVCPSCKKVFDRKTKEAKLLGFGGGGRWGVSWGRVDELPHTSSQESKINSCCLWCVQKLTFEGSLLVFLSRWPYFFFCFFFAAGWTWWLKPKNKNKKTINKKNHARPQFFFKSLIVLRSCFV